MLRARIDLLWFGGIGTFVKASHETQAEAGDRGNDAVRVNAGELRAGVVGEGANLAVTQPGRIEYALGGGRINTDAIDNSAGVDTSDHEVNIKILLDDLVSRGDMTCKQRGNLLRKMTDEVAELVLRDNYLQTQAISIAEAGGSDVLEQDARLMCSLERLGKLDRAIEFLPDDEMLAERLSAKRGLTRPEISVLLAYAKIALYDELLASNLPDDPLLVQDLTRYFPKPLHKKYKAAIARHRLRREIIVTAVTNSMVSRVGHAFVNEMRERTGMGADDIARAYAITRDIFGLRDLWREIEALDNEVPASVQTAMMIGIGQLVERCTLWFLHHGARPLDISANCAQFGPCVAKITDCLEDILAPGEKEKLSRRANDLVEQKAPEELARRVGSLDVLASALDIVRIALTAGLPVEPVGRIYFAIGSRFWLDWLRAAAAELSPDSEWQRQAIASLVDDLYGHQRELTTRILDAGGGVDIAEEMIDTWAAARKHAVDRSERVLNDLQSAPSLDLAMLTVANREIRAVIGD
jgi:glutamate dehydrogenase